MSNLKMHEAILAGASAIRAKSGVQHETSADGTVFGCALGMANVAAGAKYVQREGPLASGENPRSAGTSLVWGRWVKKKVPRPCDCTHKTEREMDDEAYRLTHQREDEMNGMFNRLNYMQLVGARMSGAQVFRLLEKEMAIEDIIPHLFDNHVVGGGRAGDGGRRERGQEGYDGFNWIAPKPWTIEQLADWVKLEEDAHEKEQAEKDAAFWSQPLHYGVSGSMPWPSNFHAPYYYVGIDWGKVSGAVAPGDDIPAVASNSALFPPLAATEITLAKLQEMVEKVKALPEPTEEEVKLSPLMKKLLAQEV